MTLRDRVEDLLGQKGIQIDEAELNALLSEDEPIDIEDSSTGELDLSISGTATGSLELFLQPGEMFGEKTKAQEKSDGLMWEPIIRTGTWARRPGPRGQKRKMPLQAVLDNPNGDQRKKMGLKQIVEAFNDEAIQHVTVPLSHDNTLEENQGFIDRLKIVKAKAKNQVTKKMEDVHVLMGGYRITEPDTKGKMERGTYANRSAGILYDYEDTERGKTWPIVLEHVALTNRPWITGMASFGRKVAGAGDSLSLSMEVDDIDPTEDELLSMLSDVADDPELSDFFADEVIWDPTGSPEWARQQVNRLLSAKRTERLTLLRAAGNTDPYDAAPYFSCRDVQGTEALISQGYDDSELLWVAGFTVTDGKLALDDVKDWKKARRAVVSDEGREDTITPLSEQDTDTNPSPELSLTGIELARYRRKQRAAGATTITPEEENDMTQLSAEQFSQLPPAAQEAIRAAQAEAARATAERDEFSTKLDRVQTTVVTGEADRWIESLKKDGFTEAKGFGGVLKKLRDYAIADDQEPAIQSDSFAADHGGKTELTVTEVLKDVFSAFKRGEDGQVELGTQLAQPTEMQEGDDAGDETGTNASQGAPGKPGKTSGEGEVDDLKLSDDELVARELKDNPELARSLGAGAKATA